MKNILLTLLLLVSSSLFAKPVLISFDGSARAEMWQDSLNFAKENNAKFTYYISAPYFLTKSDICENPYWGEKEFGYSPIKFREDNADERIRIERRTAYVHQAIDSGHEIGSHLCGHYNGWNWTKEQWRKEFEFFKWTFEYNGCTIYKSVKGIRAPCLGVNDAYKEVVKEFGLEYDSSWVYKRTHLPTPGAGELPMWKIELVGTGGIMRLPFDYEMGIMKNISQEPKFQEDLFFNSLCNEYLQDNQLPLQVCLHFEKFEGDPYWNATKRFVEWVKDKNPQYMTYLEYYRSLK